MLQGCFLGTSIVVQNDGLVLGCLALWGGFFKKGFWKDSDGDVFIQKNEEFCHYIRGLESCLER